jgi:hypothetical protein
MTAWMLLAVVQPLLVGAGRRGRKANKVLRVRWLTARSARTGRSAG